MTKRDKNKKDPVVHNEETSALTDEQQATTAEPQVTEEATATTVDNTAQVAQEANQEATEYVATATDTTVNAEATASEYVASGVATEAPSGGDNRESVVLTDNPADSATADMVDNTTLMNNADLAVEIRKLRRKLCVLSLFCLLVAGVAVATPVYFLKFAPMSAPTPAPVTPAPAVAPVVDHTDEIKALQTSDAQLSTRLKGFESGVNTATQQMKVLHSQITDLSGQIKGIAEQNAKAVSPLSRKIETIIDKQHTLEKQVSSAQRIDEWHVLEAQYLIRLAERKLQIDQDCRTAIGILKDADKVIVSLDDTRAIRLRESILQDINTLGNIQNIDYEKVLLTLQTLMRNVADTKHFSLVATINPEAEEAQDNNATVNSNVQDWKANLLVSTKKFMSNFVSIRRKSVDEMALVEPKHETYLRENISMNLLLAQKAFYQGDYAYYRTNIEVAMNLIQKYFDLDAPMVKNTYQQLAKLKSQERTALDLPKVLTSSQAAKEYVDSLNQSKQ